MDFLGLGTVEEISCGRLEGAISLEFGGIPMRIVDPLPDSEERGGRVDACGLGFEMDVVDIAARVDFMAAVAEKGCAAVAGEAEDGRAADGGGLKSED